MTVLNAAARLRTNAAFVPPPPVCAPLMKTLGMYPTGNGYTAYNKRTGDKLHQLISHLNAEAVRKEKYPQAPDADEHKCYTLVFKDGTKIRINEINSPYGFGRLSW